MYPPAPARSESGRWFWETRASRPLLRDPRDPPWALVQPQREAGPQPGNVSSEGEQAAGPRTPAAGTASRAGVGVPRRLERACGCSSRPSCPTPVQEDAGATSPSGLTFLLLSALGQGWGC